MHVRDEREMSGLFVVMFTDAMQISLIQSMFVHILRHWIALLFQKSALCDVTKGSDTSEASGNIPTQAMALPSEVSCFAFSPLPEHVGVQCRFLFCFCFFTGQAVNRGLKVFSELIVHTCLVSTQNKTGEDLETGAMRDL